MNRCESCSDKLGELSVLFASGDIGAEDWKRRGYQGVQRHHPDWTMAEVVMYVKVRAPFYPFQVAGPV